MDEKKQMWDSIKFFGLVENLQSMDDFTELQELGLCDKQNNSVYIFFDELSEEECNERISKANNLKFRSIFLATKDCKNIPAIRKYGGNIGCFCVDDNYGLGNCYTVIRPKLNY